MYIRDVCDDIKNKANTYIFFILFDGLKAAVIRYIFKYKRQSDHDLGSLLGVISRMKYRPCLDKE